MIKCEVLKDSVIAIAKGSIVYVSERQFELARRVLKPITEPKADNTAEPKKVKKKATEE